MARNRFIEGTGQLHVLPELQATGVFMLRKSRLNLHVYVLGAQPSSVIALGGLQCVGVE